MDLLPADINGCPYLILAPMEGVGDKTFRRAIATIGGFNEAVRDFLSVPKNPHIKSLAKVYECHELGSLPLAAQIMGSDPTDMALMAQELQKRGAPRIDINCGCPSNTVTGRGAGSSLLKSPSSLYNITKTVVNAVSIPVTIKMRSGYDDLSLFEENLLAAQESGIAYLTLHPRTKVEGYNPPAKWELIARAKALLKVPIVGNGDIWGVKEALDVLNLTKCDGLMIGRGCLINPFIFHEIRAYFSPTYYQASWNDLLSYLNVYKGSFSPEMSSQSQINKLKQLFSFLFKANSQILERRSFILTFKGNDPSLFFNEAIHILKMYWIF